MPPFIAALLSKGLELVANAALAKGKSYIKEKTGIDLDKERLSEDDLIKLKQFEAEHEEELLKLRLEEDKLNLAEAQLYVGDTQDARDREVKIATSEHAPWYNKAVTSFLAVITVALTFGAFARMTYLSDDPPAVANEIVLSATDIQKLIKDNATEATIQAALAAIQAKERVLEAERAQKSTQKEIMLYILGVLSAIATQIYAYYFGSSRGSAKKDETIAALTGPKGE